MGATGGHWALVLKAIGEAPGKTGATAGARELHFCAADATCFAQEVSKFVSQSIVPAIDARRLAAQNIVPGPVLRATTEGIVLHEV